ncbi:MAG TPA: hypothetical protein VLX90_12030 [Steroidobacteraceae bacterium]|nr:hypothetical protein [Steroidobacteraceae bacterium]
MRSTMRTFTASLLRHQRGQGMVEYLVVGTALAVALFVPVPGVQPAQTVGQMLAGRIHDLYYNLTFFLSLP